MLLFSDGAGGIVDLTGSAALPAPSSNRGFDETADAGTTADYFVDGSVVSSGDGTSLGTAFKTVAEAVAQVKSDGSYKTVAIKDGIYREKLTSSMMTGVQIGMSGYGTDKPTLTGQDQIAGWTQCTSADESRLGAGYASIYKTTISLSAVPNIDAINLYEGETPLPICQTQLPGADLFYTTYDKDYERADSFTLNGSNQVTAITDASVLSGLTSAQLVGRAYVKIYRNPNANSTVQITAFSGSTIDITGLVTVQGNTPTPDPDVLRWNLMNCLPKITQGTYGTWDEGDGTATIYVWPYDPASLASDMSYGARDGIIEIPQLAENISISNMKLLGASGSGNVSGYCISIGNNDWPTSNITLENLRVGNNVNATGGYGAIIARKTHDLTIRYVTIRNCSGTAGTFMSGGSQANNGPALRTTVERCVFQRLSSTGTRWSGTHYAKCIHNTYRDTGKASHANAWNFYQGCDNVLFAWNVTRECYGYGTWQGSSNIMMCYNYHHVNMSDTDSRGFEDQNKSAQPQPDPGCTNFIWNNDLPPDVSDLTAQAIGLGRPWDTLWGGADAEHPNNARYVMINNVTHGGAVTEPYVSLGSWGEDWEEHWDDRPGFGPNHVERQREGNLYTGLGFWQTPSAPYSWFIDATEYAETDLSVNYTDVAARDYTCPPGSPILSRTGVSIADVLTAAAAIWPGVDLTVDRDGNSINTTIPKVGALHGDRNAQTAAIWS